MSMKTRTWIHLNLVTNPQFIFGKNMIAHVINPVQIFIFGGKDLNNNPLS